MPESLAVRRELILRKACIVSFSVKTVIQLGGAWFFALALLVSANAKPAATAPNTFPGLTWTKARPQDLGFSESRLASATQYVKSLPPSHGLIIAHGQVLAEWGTRNAGYRASAVSAATDDKRPSRPH